MISFDYAHHERAFIAWALVSALRRDGLTAPIIAFAGAMLLLVAAWGIEQHRIDEAVRIEAGYRTRLLSERRSFKQLEVFEERLRAIATLDGEVAGIVRSGDRNALQMAAIAQALPERAWLTSISQQSSSVTMQGRAASLDVVAQFMHALGRSELLHEPQLMNVGAGATSSAVTFSILARVSP